MISTGTLVPFARLWQENNPLIQLMTYEMQTCDIVDKFSKAEIDMAIMATPVGNAVKQAVPERMIDSKLKKFTIKI